MNFELLTNSSLLTPGPVYTNTELIPITLTTSSISAELQHVLNAHSIYYPNSSENLDAITLWIESSRLYRIFLLSFTNMNYDPDILNLLDMIAHKLGITKNWRTITSKLDFETKFAYFATIRQDSFPFYTPITRNEFVILTRGYFALAQLDSDRSKLQSIGSIAANILPFSDRGMRLTDDDLKLLKSKFNDLCNYDGLVKTISMRYPHFLGIVNPKSLYVTKCQIELNDYSSISSKFLGSTAQKGITEWIDSTADTLSTDNLCTPLRAIEGLQVDADDLTGIDEDSSILDQDWVVTTSLKLDDLGNKFMTVLTQNEEWFQLMSKHNPDLDKDTLLATRAPSNQAVILHIPIHILSVYKSNEYANFKYYGSNRREYSHTQLLAVADSLKRIWNKIIKPAVTHQYVLTGITKMKDVMLDHFKVSLFDFIAKRYNVTADEINAVASVIIDGPSAYPNWKDKKENLKKLLVGVCSRIPQLLNGGIKQSNIPSTYVSRINDDLYQSEKSRIQDLKSTITLNTLGQVNIVN